ncbi:MAG: hypothetical protein GDA41_06580 [Rhodospirillales bacterium]|nr:hypothetical protein [Rhodospirillales bacterium]
MDMATIELMRELAIVQGKRKIDGTWTEPKSSTVERMLVQAIRLQKSAEQRASEEALPKNTITTPVAKSSSTK